MVNKNKTSKLLRTVVHTSPHLDEYFAELLFRAWLPDDKKDIDYLEMSVILKTDDTNCLANWPNAAVFGIAKDAAKSINPLFWFDEHLKEGNRTRESCSQIVVDKLLQKLPGSVRDVLYEVNKIDSSGGAHEQSISQLIKPGHKVRFLIKSGKDEILEEYDWLSPKWKKTLMNACIVSVIYCLEKGIDLRLDPEKLKDSLIPSFENYCLYTPHKTDNAFNTTMDKIQSSFINQKSVFKLAKIGDNKDQLLVLSRVAYAMNAFLGEDISKIILTHFWEIVYQSQATYEEFKSNLASLKQNGDLSNHSKYGIFERIEIPKSNFNIRPEYNRTVKWPRGYHADIWVLGVEQSPRLYNGNKVLQNFLRKNYGFGISLVKNSVNGSNGVFKGHTIPQWLWEKLCDFIVRMEPDQWYLTNTSPGNYAPFLINGNDAHQYVPFSRISTKTLAKYLKMVVQNKTHL